MDEIEPSRMNDSFKINLNYLLFEVLGLLLCLSLGGVGLVGVPLQLLDGGLRLLHLLEGVLLHLVVHLHRRLQVLVVPFELLFAVECRDLREIRWMC